MIPKFLALDLETTGLHPTKDRILEIAVVVLTEDLEEIGSWETTISQPTKEIKVDDYVREMHVSSGLLTPELEVTGDPMLGSVAEGYLVKVCGCFPEKPILLGSSVHFDRGFLAYRFRSVDRLLSHRHLDASALKLAFPHVEWPGQEGPKHRAMPDARYSIEIVKTARRVMNG